MNHRNAILILGGLIFVVLIAIFVVDKQNTNLMHLDSLNKKNAHSIASTEPIKIDFGTSTPSDFPNDIPLENGAKVEQSFSLNYSKEKQLTMVFLSTKTVKENYDTYSSLLKKQNWTISNKLESKKLSSLYGLKEGNEINVTISENTSTSSIKSQVSVSVLKK